MKLLDYFAQFLRDKVNLNQSRLDDLNSRVDAITEALKSDEDLGGRVLDTVPQGSWAHKTIIRPAFGKEFDADFLVQLAEDANWSADPQKYSDAIWEALSNHGIYKIMTTRKNRCVRIRYANFCHVDVVPYVVRSDGYEVIVHRTTNTFETTNPVGFTAWLQDKDDHTSGNLRRVLRLVKYLRDRQGAFAIKSVLLTTLVGNVVDSWRTFDPDYYRDVPTTLVHVLEDLDTWLQARPYKSSISDPSCPTTSFDHRWTDQQYPEHRRRSQPPRTAARRDPRRRGPPATYGKHPLRRATLDGVLHRQRRRVRRQGARARHHRLTDLASSARRSIRPRAALGPDDSTKGPLRSVLIERDGARALQAPLF
jgi:hypothetical protein